MVESDGGGGSDGEGREWLNGEGVMERGGSDGEGREWWRGIEGQRGGGGE